MDNSSISILLIDDHAVVREGLKSALIREGFSVIGEAASKAEAFAQITHKNPRVIILDLNLPDGSGLEVLTWARKISPTLGIVILSLLDDGAHVIAAAQAGASAFVNKSAPMSDLLAAVLHSSQVPLSFISRGLPAALSHRSQGFGLTAREIEVLGYLPRGSSSLQIAHELFVTEATNKTYLSAIYRKLHANNRSEAVAIALKSSLLS